MYLKHGVSRAALLLLSHTSMIAMEKEVVREHGGRALIMLKYLRMNTNGQGARAHETAVAC